MSGNINLDHIRGLISRASPEVAAGLFAHLELLQKSARDKLPFDELLELARSKIVQYHSEIERSPSVSRIFFQPFEALFEDFSPDQLPMPGSFPREQLGKIWNVIEENFKTGEFEEVYLKAYSASAAHDIKTAEKHVVRLRTLALMALEAIGGAALHTFDASINEENSQRFFRLLQVVKAADERKLSLFVDVERLSDADLRPYSDLVRSLDANDFHLSADLLLCLMGNTQKPWQVLRIIYTGVIGANDHKLAVSGYGVVGDRLLAIMAKQTQPLAQYPKMLEIDSAKMVYETDAFAQISKGIERSNLLADGGPWRKKLNEIRNQAGNAFNEICEKAVTVVTNCFALDKGRIKGVGAMEIPRCFKELDMQKVKLSLEYASFIRDTRLLAPNAGFSGARDQAHKELLRHCDQLKNGMIAIKDHVDCGKFYAEWSKWAIELVSIVDDASAAKSLQRRIAA